MEYGADTSTRGNLRDPAVRAAADRLWCASHTRRPTAPIRTVIGAHSIDAAYAVQQELVARRVAAGGVVVGRKIGLTSPAVQQQLGVDQPDFGVLLADMDISASGVVPADLLLQPRAEAEIAFALKNDLTDPDDPKRIRAAIDYAVGAVEIVDSRISDWDLSIADTIADNASSGLFVLGERRLPIAELDTRGVVMRMYANDRLASQGVGTACLGDPLAALAWLASTAAAFGDPLRAGQLVLSGALGPMVLTPAGTHIRAEIGALGTVSVLFSPGGQR
ncbi:2-keto-4-pentenoate hydratase [Mycobacterium vicinigordonae]|uniref:Fumarylacetoacetate hydrolase family protein n=1 Tax=Mycobacterium vicinigordonae TaxID=1719132 RepID=A0A7D6ED06_9MYCO|nr:fumarylacetoacetate hydrolase family protein [Mycobacterium vicinigordonae]QLL09945.1 fumarylacetoacetate hydrolase family protein [Mycobacterium vicinigordonae]